MTYYFWGKITNFVYTSNGSVDDALWSRGNSAGGSFPLWTWTETAASTFQSGVSATYDIYLTAQDFVLDSEPALLVASTDLVSPFGAQGNLSGVLSFSRTNGIVDGGLVWFKAGATTGTVDLEFRTFTDSSSATTTPPTTSGITLTGSEVTLASDISGLTDWSDNWNSTNFVFGYSTATSTPSGTVRSVYFRGYDTSGTATTPLVQVATGITASTQWYVTTSNATWYYVYTVVSGTDTGIWERTFDVTTGAVGTATEVLPQTSYSKYFGVQNTAQADGTQLVVTEGLVSGAHVLEITRLAADGTSLGVAQSYALPGTSGIPWRMVGNVWDSATAAYDLNALTYLSNGQVHLVVLDATGTQVGDDFVLPTDSDVFGLGKMRVTGTRLQIPYTIADANGGYDVQSLIYDFSGAAVSIVLSGSGQWAGTTFDDTFTDGGGDHLIAGGPGNDTFSAFFTSNLVHVSTTAAGDVQVVTPGGTTTLEDFETIRLLNGTIGISGTQLTPALNPGLGLRATNPHDFDGSGTSDVLLRNADGVTYLWSMNGTTVTTGATTSVQVGDVWRIAGIGDFDGNGTSDILWAYENAADASDGLNGVSYVSFQNGAGATGGGVVQQLSSDWKLAGIGDFDGDGKSDVLYRNASTGRTYVDFMDGNQIDWSRSGFTSSEVTDTNWSVAAVADFGGDGKADVLWRYYNAADTSDALNGTLYEWTMDGTNVTSAGLLSQQASGDWQVAGTGDFDGNGTADVLFRYDNAANASDPLNGLTYVAFMSGTTVTSGAPTQWQVGNDWQLATIGDFDGNGKSDILWQQTATGSTYLWQMDGTTVVGAGFTSAQAGTGWTAQNGVSIG